MRRTLAAAAVPLLLGAAPPSIAPVQLQRLETQASERALGVGDPAPRFSWILSSARRGVKQAAFEIRVATTEELVRSDQPDVWASGRVASADPWAKYAGKPLASRTRYYWSVRVWTGRESPTEWAKPDLVRDGLPVPRTSGAASGSRAPSARASGRRPKVKPTTRRSARRASSAGRSAG